MSTYYKVGIAGEAIDAEETLGAEVRVWHRTREGAQDAIDSMDWDSDWGEEPEYDIEDHEHADDAALRADHPRAIIRD
jgi:hypothetical protein